MSGLALVRLIPDLDRLARAAASHGLIGAGGDFGYALHAALAAAFGNSASKPFLLRTEIRRPEVLGYTNADPSEFHDLAHLPPVDHADLVEPLFHGGVEVRELPDDWTAGRKLDFETRVRPVIRTRPQGRNGRTHERDVFLEELDGCEPPPKDAPPHRAWPMREHAYAKWLARELARGTPRSSMLPGWSCSAGPGCCAVRHGGSRPAAGWRAKDPMWSCAGGYA